MSLTEKTMVTRFKYKKTHVECAGYRIECFLHIDQGHLNFFKIIQTQ